MTGGFVFAMAWREVRASARRLALLGGGVTAGVAALVAINGFTANLRDSVARQAEALLGADLSLEARSTLPDTARAALRTIGGVRSDVTTFSAMTYATGSETARLTQLNAVSGGWPFYGRIETAPASAWPALQRGRNAIVDPGLLASLGIQVGDSIAVGETRFQVIGTIAAVPGDVGIRSAFGPRAFVNGAYLDDTQLLGFGARAEYATFVKLPPGADAQLIAAEWRPRLRADRVRIRTVADDQARLDNALTRLTNFLGLVALVALLLGGLGVASAVHVQIRSRLDSIAILRCIGATSGQVLGAYLLQALFLALAGSAAGAALGLGVQRLLPALLADLLPVDVHFQASWPAAFVGLAMGVWVAMAFALLPLLQVRQVSPLAALRRDAMTLRTRLDRWRLLTFVALGATILLLAVAEAGRLRVGIAFAGAVGLVLLLLWVSARLLMRIAQRAAGQLPYAWRQGITNLRRPANQTTAVVTSIGFGAFLLATLLLSQHVLLSALDVAAPTSHNPNMVFFDIQPTQLAGVDSLLTSAGARPAAPVAIVPMRIASVKGRSVPARLADTTNPGGWALRREYRSTWRDTLTSAEHVVAGSWWRGPMASPPRISVERDLAAELGVGVGDDIVWDVQGTRIPTRVASIREVDWTRFEPNFFVVFEPGVLEQAPHTWVTMARLDRPELRGRLPRTIAERYPNVTSLDLTLIQDAISKLLARVTMAIRFMALFSLGTGVVVLVGAILTSRFQRVRESALLRTLGASRSQLVRIALGEYAALGLVAGLAALLLAGIATWALARWVFDVPFTLPLAPASLLVVATTVLTMLTGLWTALDVARQTPLGVLRGVAEG